MKHIIHIIVLAVITVVYISCEKEDYALQRLSAPAQLTAVSYTHLWRNF